MDTIPTQCEACITAKRNVDQLQYFAHYMQHVILFERQIEILLNKVTILDRPKCQKYTVSSLFRLAADAVRLPVTQCGLQLTSSV